MNTEESLKSKTIKGLFWSFIDKFTAQIITFIIGIILARLLSPKEFGLIGMIAVFISISQIFINSGFKEALIRKKTISEEDYNTVFIFNILAGLILYFILFLISGWVSEFYSEPQLKLLIRVLALGLIINSITIVQFTRVTKKIDFKSLTRISIISSIGSGVLGVFLAYLGYGVWSLIWRDLTNYTLSAFLLINLNKWYPNFRFSKKSFLELFSFGGNLMINAIMGAFFRNVYFLVIGKYYAASILGQFTRAETFKRLPSQTVSDMVNRVSYPILAELQDDQMKLYSAYKRLIKSTMFITIIGMFTLSVISENLTVLLMGEQWGIAGQYLRILCFSGLFFPLDALNSNMLKIMNRSDLILKIGIWRKLLTIPLILIIIFVGIKPFLYALILHQIISFLMISNYSKSFINYGTVEQIKDIIPFFIIGVLIIIIVLISEKLLNFSPIFNMIFQLSISFFVMVITCEISKIEAYTYLKKLIFNFNNR